MLQEQTFEAGAVPIHYAATREDGRPLLLLHGVTSHWQSWLPVMPDLALRWRLFALDLRGHGRSGRAPGAYRVTDYAGDVAALLERRIAEPAVLVGHSLGAIVSIAVAAQFQNVARAVVLEDPPLAAFRHLSISERPESEAFTVLRDLACSELPVDELEAALAARQPDLDTVAVRTRAVMISQLDPDVLTTILEDRAREEFDVDACLERIACPVLLLQGNPAIGGALADADALRAVDLLERCTHVCMPDVGHNIHAAQPLAFARVVHDFLEAL